MLHRFPDRRAAIVLFVVAGLAAGAISWFAGQSQNFEVFRAASHALVDGRDLYTKNAADYFKYSPTFALLFLPITWLPSWLGAVLWGAVNFGAVVFGLDRLFGDDARQKRVAQGIALAGILVATDGDQSNLLVTGLVLLALAAYERGRVGAFGQLVVVAALVKIFPLACASLIVLLPRGQRWSAVAAIAGALVTWIALPLIVLDPEELLAQYGSWLALLGHDHGNHGWSVMSLLHDAGIGWRTTSIQLLALAAQTVPIALGVRLGTDRAFRRTLVCSLLVFAVLFNHRAEYASFAISAVALGIWYASSPTPRSHLTNVLVLLAIVAPGPFFTRADPEAHGLVAFLGAHRLFHPLRVAPLLVVWVGMQHELLARFFEVRIRMRSFAGGK